MKLPLGRGNVVVAVSCLLRYRFSLNIEGLFAQPTLDGLQAKVAVVRTWRNLGKARFDSQLFGNADNIKKKLRAASH